MKSQVLVSGCFNICHAGHIELFEFASKYGEVTVGINSDAYLDKKYNGLFVPMIQRAYVLSSNKFVKNVVVFQEEHPGKLIQRIKPNYYIKGPDYLNKELPEMPQVLENKVKLIIHQTKKIQNSSDLFSFL